MIVDVSSLKQVEEGLYHIDDPEGDYWLCMTVPDETALLLQYDIEFDPGYFTEPKLSNTVQLEGVAYSTAEDVNFKTNDSSVQITRGQLVIHKMDAETSKFLPDAKFTIDRYKNSGEFENFISGTTDANGELTFSITSAEQTLSPNVLYRLTETKAPDNYILDSTPKYLFFYEKGADAKEAFKTALGSESITDNGQTVTVDDVTFGCSTNTTQLTVKNTYNQLSVYKYWQSAADGKPLANADIPAKSIQVQLYRYTAGQTAASAVPVDTQELNKDNGWSFTWSGENQIPAADEKGKKVLLLCKEVTTGNWVTEINNNNGIQTGKIFITNKVYSGYVLPLHRRHGHGALCGGGRYADRGCGSAAGQTQKNTKRKGSEQPMEQKSLRRRFTALLLMLCLLAAGALPAPCYQCEHPAGGCQRKSHHRHHPRCAVRQREG